MTSAGPSQPHASVQAVPRPTNRLGTVALVFALIGLVIAFIAPAALFAWFFTLPAFIVAIVGLTRRNQRKPAAVAGVTISTFAFLASIVSFSVYSAGVPTHAADSQSALTSQHSTAPKAAPESSPKESTPKKSTPTPTPTPPPPVPDVSAQPLVTEQASLTAAGYTVVVVDSSGTLVADPTSYTFVSEFPAAGTLLALGSTVTLIVAAPPPPPPVPAPVAPSHPGGATAQCNDGTYSYSAHRRGTCSHHGGVAVWF